MEMRQKKGVSMDRRAKAVFSYLLGFISGFFILMTERKDPFLRKCAAQSVIFSAAWWISSMVLRGIPFLGKLLRPLVHAVASAAWIGQIVRAAGGRVFYLPGITGLSQRLEKLCRKRDRQKG